MTQEWDTAGSPTSNDSFDVLLRQVVLSTARDVDVDVLQDVLQRVCRFFGYEIAFVYELEPSKGLVLQVCAGSSSACDVPFSFFPDRVFDEGQLEGALGNPLCRTGDLTHNEDLLSALENLFTAQNMFVVFILDEQKAVVGCVGMVDACECSPLSDDDAVLVETMLTPLVQNARLRACERRLYYTSGTLESIMDHIGFDIYVNDFDTHKMLYANKSMADPYGGWDNMRGKICFKALYDDKESECLYCPKKHLIDDEGNPSKIYSWDYQRPFDGRWFRVISAAFQWTDGSLAHVISSTDINEAKENELLVKRMAYYDLLTSIPNRRKLEKDLTELIDANRGGNVPVAVMFLDLNSFKAVNDHYGHSGGDALLQHVSRMFSDHPLTAGRCYRYGGDEFIFLLNDATVEGIESMKSAIGEMLGKPFELEGDVLTCSGSVGIACYPDDGSTYWELLDKADDAMYEKKQANGPSRLK